jgi:hypothetical protein
MSLNRTIWILWLQGWHQAPWLSLQVGLSWEINNPDWTVQYVSLDNLKEFVTDIDYIYDSNKNISNQAKSDIIRLSLLKNHGGVWADATMLCMQPLNNWVYDAILPSQFWMYHGNGAHMPADCGPASWFIVSVKESYIITQWKNLCDQFWNHNNETNNYSWMDCLFRFLFENDSRFKDLWNNIPYLYCEVDGQSHCLAPNNNGMFNHSPHIQKLFLEKPPYALKLWKEFNDIYKDINTELLQKSNALYAIQMSKRKYVYKHEWK